MQEVEDPKTVARVCERRCDTCIFGPNSPISAERRREYEQAWRRGDTFQNCHMGTVTGDTSLVCRGFYDWTEKVGWEPLLLRLARAFDRLRFVPVPSAHRPRTEEVH